jgi:hypothetical protein
MIGVPDDEALAAFPELVRLAELRGAGWSFTPAHDDAGELIQLNGMREWPRGHVDAVRVRFTSDAAAMRCDQHGDVLWTFEGTLAQVIDGLMSLPAPP